MTDRELLELAAKAAGIENLATKGDIIICNDEYGFSVVWNPLTDDGDAFRLAVRLRLGLEWWKNGVRAESAQHGPEVIHHLEDDPYAATRRAIVRAAAAMAGDAP